jgi:hypothetical protein
MVSPNSCYVAEAALAGRQSTQYCTNWRREKSVVIPFLLLVIDLQSASDNRPQRILLRQPDKICRLRETKKPLAERTPTAQENEISNPNL